MTAAGIEAAAGVAMEKPASEPKQATMAEMFEQGVEIETAR